MAGKLLEGITRAAPSGMKFSGARKTSIEFTKARFDPSEEFWSPTKVRPPLPVKLSLDPQLMKYLSGRVGNWNAL
ncbi:hypothetical protein CCACVL1_26453 [Corchorus capsularis]|uniref:Uncharacterized protein n=1 Tax=Corchorus capsularis TaxID=210143 RepID=A0A1R3GER0_COCAP|nr:hypothetical protein CCACVL1_26453 [Corchorus capsularis]